MLIKTTYEYRGRTYTSEARLAAAAGPLETFSEAVRDPRNEVRIVDREYRNSSPKKAFGEALRDGAGVMGVTAVLGGVAAFIESLASGSPRHLLPGLTLAAGGALAVGIFTGVTTYQEERRPPAPEPQVTTGYLFREGNEICLSGGLAEPGETTGWEAIGRLT